jgi:hypothetical protein
MDIVLFLGQVLHFSTATVSLFGRRLEVMIAFTQGLDDAEIK